MGFFSWECKECGHPLLSDHIANKINSWMTLVVVIQPAGGLLIGKYDGYGRISGREIKYSYGGQMSKEEPQCYHGACWEKAGRPKDHTEGSRSAPDQGFFFHEGAHDMPKPNPPTDGMFSSSDKETMRKDFEHDILKEWEW